MSLTHVFNPCLQGIGVGELLDGEARLGAIAHRQELRQIRWINGACYCALLFASPRHLRQRGTWLLRRLIVVGDDRVSIHAAEMRHHRVSARNACLIIGL